MDRRRTNIDPRLWGIGMPPEQRARRNRVAEVLGPHIAGSTRQTGDTRPQAIAVGKVAGRVFVVGLDKEDGAWRERDTDIDKQLDRLDRVINPSTGGCGCFFALLISTLIIAGLETRWLDGVFGVTLSEFRAWWVYAVVVAVLLGIWVVYDYLAQWNRYVKVRPRLEGLMRTHGLTPHEVLTRIVRPARIFERSISHFIARDDAWRRL